MKEIKLPFLEEEYKKCMIPPNEETFDWKTAAKYWAEGKGDKLECQHVSNFSWIPVIGDLENRASSVVFIKDLKYRLRPKPVEFTDWFHIAYWNGKRWAFSDELYKSTEDFIVSRNNHLCFISPKMDCTGRLIIPNEFKHLK